MGILEKIAEIEAEMARTQKNKATEYHLGTLKAKLAKYRAQLIEAATTTKEKGEGFDVMKSGDARAVMIGFPSVGKSTLLSKVTETQSEQANYEFTTLTCIPGNILYNDAKIQLLDLPGIIEGASQGKGRGKQVIAVARTADLILMMMDAQKGEVMRPLLEKELSTCGIRLNQRPPRISFKQKATGGIKFNATCPLTQMDAKLCERILKTYKIHSADVLFREDASTDELIDVIQGNRIYMPCLYCYNKCDMVSLEECERLSRLPNSIVCSCHQGLNFDTLLARIWEMLDLVRVYTKKTGSFPDFEDPLVMRKGSTVEAVVHGIHRSLVEETKYCKVWGTSAKHNGQQVGMGHIVDDEDVIQIVKR